MPDARCLLMLPIRVQAWREANEMPDPELTREVLAGHRARSVLLAPRPP